LHRIQKRLLLLAILPVVLVFTAAFKILSKKETNYKPFVTSACQEASYFLDIRTDTLHHQQYVVRKKESLKNVLNHQGINFNDYEQIRNAARHIINLNYAASGLTCHLFKTQSGDLRYLVLERNPYTFVVLDLHKENPRAYDFEKKPVYVRRDVAGVINGDLYTTFKELDIPRNLIYQIDKVYDYTFNLYKLRNGDTIRIQYEELIVDGIPQKATELKACMLTNKGKRYYAIAYKSPGQKTDDFYDEQGQALKRGFLEKPLKYGRISSRFSKNRKHPVLNINKAHLGTDFAAPHGTPIIATADGVVSEASHSKYNGNYVKIIHDKVYTTQYLHMSRFASGIKKGRKVKQGEVIGYVGSTGLATGPHVCYRFWKNGQQVDPFRENLKFARPMDPSLIADYRQHFRKTEQQLMAAKLLNGMSLMKQAVASAN
jgi:murein DD-endopeptidase MepM/ murein hydrolase activator NlpD